MPLYKSTKKHKKIHKGGASLVASLNNNASNSEKNLVFVKLKNLTIV